MESATSSTEGRAVRVTWSIPEWSQSVGIAVPTFHTLKVPPKSLKIGKLRRITESPQQWLARMKKRGGAETKRAP
jgi:hypothetical protein